MESQSILSEKIRHVGKFDFKGTYTALFEWLVDRGYTISEKYYKEVIGQGGAKEVDIKWIASKIVSSYFKFEITLEYKIIALVALEEEINGVKQKINKGDLSLTIKSALIKDYVGEWNSNFLKILRRIYDKNLVSERTEKQIGELIGETEAFVAETKAFLILTGKR